jgi:hypothetical protein
MIKRIFPSIAILIMIFMIGPFSLSEPSSQGIEGYVYRISGNQMPSPDIKPIPPKGIKTSLYIFHQVNLSQVSRQAHSSFYSFVGTKLVKKAATDTNGYFRVILPAGKYSLFVKKGELYYANWFDGDNNIAPVQVYPGAFAHVTFKMDYDASY